MANVNRSSSMFDGTRVLNSELKVQLNWHLNGHKMYFLRRPMVIAVELPWKCTSFPPATVVDHVCTSRLDTFPMGSRDAHIVV